MRIAMHNKTMFIPISLDNLTTVTGGYHDADPPTPRQGIGAPAKVTLAAHLGEILHHFADLASQTAPRK